MATAVYVCSDDVIDYTPSVDVAAGDVIDLGSFIGIALRDIKANELGALKVRGQADVAKGAGAINLGTKLYYDATNKVATATGPADAVMGFCSRAALSGDTAVRLLFAPGLS